LRTGYGLNVNPSEIASISKETEHISEEIAPISKETERISEEIILVSDGLSDSLFIFYLV
jgi:hypothetical protein